MNLFVLLTRQYRFYTKAASGKKKVQPQVAQVVLSYKAILCIPCENFALFTVKYAMCRLPYFAKYTLY